MIDTTLEGSVRTVTFANRTIVREVIVAIELFVPVKAEIQSDLEVEARRLAAGRTC